MADTHIQVGTTATLEVTFYADGVPADDGTPTIGITKADGTALVNPGTATSSGGVGVRRYALAAQTALNQLTATWTGATQTMTTHAEIVGTHLYTQAALRAVKVGGTPNVFANTTDYPEQTLLDRRVEVTDDFQARCGWSFIPRFARETLNGNGSGVLILGQRRCLELLSVTVNGAVKDVAGYTLSRSGMLRATVNYLPSGWFDWGVDNVTVEYVHGWDRPPAAVSSVGLARTAMLLMPSQAGSTVSTWTTPDGTTYSYDQAGQSISGGGRRHYGVPAIDSVLNDPAYSARGRVVA